MMRYIFLSILSCLLLVVTGCTGAKEIQNETYITAIGFDYSKGQYTVYLQALNFSNIAKQEGGSGLQQASPILIGQATGKSIQAAISKLEQHAALPLYYGHVNTFVLSKNVIEKHLASVIEFIGQNSFLRYNCWLYGTNGDIKKVLSAESFFNYPSIYTVLHSPSPLLKENYSMQIEKYNRIISKYNQSVGTLIIPSIDIEKKIFMQDEKPINIAALTGGFVVSQQQYKGWVKKHDLIGLKWFSEKAARIPISLFNERVSVEIIKPKSTIKVISDPKPAYDLIVKANAYINQNVENLSVSNIEKELAQKVKNEILITLEKSNQINADLLNITEIPYRYHHKKWDINVINNINKNSVKHIHVKIKIQQNINYKR
ncbi:hypothetical protein COJ85_03660 [Bacillus sp. AFS076308]|nr:hypothetical protein COJ85_03660 [Bacillus sp. AFS076308]PGV50642.1 hypothetical protein COD92_17030 [Bacillus sp. AFS037270]